MINLFFVHMYPFFSSVNPFVDYTAQLYRVYIHQLMYIHLFIQILLKISTVHRRVFVYIITFLKKLLDHSDINQMDAKFLGKLIVTMETN